MRRAYRILLYTILCGLLVWIISAAIGKLFYDDRSFLQLLITDVPIYSLYVRLLALVFLWTSGLLLFRAITRRRQVEQALRRAEREKAIILDSLSEHVLYHDTTLTILWANRAASASVGLAPAELVGRHCYEIWHQGSAPCPGCPVLRALHTGQCHQNEIYSPDSRIWFIRGYPVRNRRGEVTGAVEITLDITERKQAEAALERHTAQLEALHQVGLELTTELDLDPLLQSIVVRAVQLLKARAGGLYLYRPDQDSLEWVVTVGPEMPPIGSTLRRGEGVAGRVWDTGQPIIVDDYGHWEGRAIQYNGYPCTAIVGVPIHWGRKFLGVLDILADSPRAFSSEDIALLEQFVPLAAAALENARLYGDLQQQMDWLKQAQAQLVQSARMAAVGELAAGIAHELNNPLTSILGFSELLLEDSAPGSPHKKDAQKIAAHAQRARSIIRNLLDFARQTRPEKQPADVNVLLQQAHDLVREHLKVSGIAVEESYSPDLDPLWVDQGQLRQVFLNLIHNAVQAMPDGGTLRLRTARVGEEVILSISDSGAGIPPEIQAHLFEPFFSTRPDATGLGLSTCLGIVQEHGGRITVDSQASRGSTFTIWLPAEGGERRATELPTSKLPGSALGDQPLPPARSDLGGAK